MRRALRKTAFHLAVLLLTVAFLIPAMVVLDRVTPVDSGDRLFPGLITIFLCVILADRLVSFLFRAGGLTEERWSVLDHGRRRRPG
jgi:hypothetical protein